MSDFGIYVHWPYCAAICPYCDFNVYRARGATNAPLIAAIEADMAGHAARFGKRQATSLFFGGGTPSLLRGDEIARLIDAASSAFTLAADCEITLEANPEDSALFAEQAAAGINRFSIGAQALDDDALRALGRHHDAHASLRAVEAAAATHQRVSLDLIYAREGQSVDDWRAELTRALALPVEHVSLYQLTIEPETAFARRVDRGQLTPPDADTGAELYEVTQEVCEAAGFPAYEISNHARDEGARARHNLLYWRSDDWIGVGPGAHGRVTHNGARVAIEAQRRPADYIDAVSEHGVGWISDAALTQQEIADETLLMGIRTDEGVEIARLEELRGMPLKADAVAWLTEQELIEPDDARIRLTKRGRALANKIALELSV
ncbi:radical SAM family heme chaperone HemW [Terricaulis silvestris]|uniref:Heme chaperone HemW n=1 Tax=Terricaulis silvestris TaxID=2686094 RepID=A0A6I6N0W9_9CAUL|nr:radical SAM family heme chaperone HemW [Terricaulis silvestris]QGZ96983.1 Oxygen-independent coproporphyrinogen-III oxidase 1 [Terricaulis silvestris]